MSSLLQISTSINGTDSLSSSLASDVVEQWRGKHPSGQVVTRDLSAAPLPHLTQARFAALSARPQERTSEQAAIAAQSDELVAELKAASVIVLAVPMYNFGIPSTLKAYFDHVARAGVTFRYTPDGPEGLLTGKRAVVVATRGGSYVGTPLDTQTDYVKNFLAFLGIEDTEFVYAEGVAMGEEAVSRAIASARSQIQRLPLKAA